MINRIIGGRSLRPQISAASQCKKPCSLSEKQGLTNQCTAPPFLLLLLDRNDSIPAITNLLFCQGLQ